MEMFDDVNDMWEFFYGILHQCLDSYIPLKKIYHKYSNQHTPWLTDELKLMPKVRLKLDYLRSLLSCAHQAPRFAATLWPKINGMIGYPRKQAPVLDSRLSINDINQFFGL